jgi:hypothetical protein
VRLGLTKVAVGAEVEAEQQRSPSFFPGENVLSPRPSDGFY